MDEVPQFEQLWSRAVVVRRCRVVLSSQLAGLFGVTTDELMRAVKRNRSRFPPDFAFRLTSAEWAALGSPTWGATEAPYGFTEGGVAMLAGVLRSDRAAAVSVEIVRALLRRDEDGDGRAAWN